MNTDTITLIMQLSFVIVPVTIILTIFTRLRIANLPSTCSASIDELSFVSFIKKMLSVSLISLIPLSLFTLGIHQQLMQIEGNLWLCKILALLCIFLSAFNVSALITSDIIIGSIEKQCDKQIQTIN